MPFFSSRHEPEEEHVVEHSPVEEPKKGHGLFGRRRSTSPTPTHSTTNTRHTVSTMHSNNTHHTNNHTAATGAPPGTAGSGLSSKRGSLLHRSFGNGNDLGHDVEMDPSIVNAREALMAAEASEREADKALMMARQHVHAAREHVRRLELEAKEEARRAKIKAYHAREVSKRGKQLGRHDL